MFDETLVFVAQDIITGLKPDWKTYFKMKDVDVQTSSWSMHWTPPADKGVCVCYPMECYCGVER